jgi:hypothetical protein
MFKNIVNQSQYAKLSDWVVLCNEFSKLALAQQVVTNYYDSNKNIFKFISNETVNIRYGIKKNVDDQKIMNAYHNGLAAPYPFAVDNTGPRAHFAVTDVILKNSNITLPLNISPFVTSIKTAFDTINNSTPISPSYHDGEYGKYSENILLKSNDKIFSESTNLLL